jgi:hypothetical protein
MADDRNQMLALLMGEAMKDLQPAPERSPKQRIATAISDVMLSIGQGLANRGRGGQTTGLGAALSAGPLLAQQRQQQAEAKRTQALQMAMQAAQVQGQQSDRAMRQERLDFDRNKAIFAAMSGTQGPTVAGFDFGIQTRPDEPPIPTPKQFELPHPAVGALGRPPTETDVIARQEAMAGAEERGRLGAGRDFAVPEIRAISPGQILEIQPDGTWEVHRVGGGPPLTGTEQERRDAIVKWADDKGLDPDTLTELQQADAVISADNARILRNRTPLVPENLTRGMTDDQLKAANTITQQFRTNQKTREFNILLTSYNNIMTLTKDASPIGDIGLVFAIMKMFDPPSVVREGEQAMARGAGSVPQWVRNELDRALTGLSLENTRGDFQATAQRLFTAASEGQRRNQNSFRSQLRINNIPADLIPFFIADLTVLTSLEPDEEELD